MRDAHESEIIARVVADEVKRPKGEQRKVPTPWEIEHAVEFLRGLEGHPDRTLYVVEAFTALRRSVLLGLTWSDVDLGRAHLTVSQKLTTIARGKFMPEPTKSEAGAPPMHAMAAR